MYQPEEKLASPRAFLPSPAAVPAQIAELQRTGGNQAVARALEGGPAAAAAEVHAALRFVNSPARALKALEGHSADDREALRSSFYEQQNITLADYLYEQLDGADLVRAFALLDSDHAQDPYVALGLALIPRGTRNAEIWRVLDGANEQGRKEIERRYNAVFGTGGRHPKGLLKGSLRDDLKDELSGWEQEKALAQLDHPLTDAEHLYFLSLAIAGTHTDSVVALIQRVWKEGAAAMLKLHQDWARYVQRPIPGVSDKPLSKLGLAEAMREELSLEAFGLVKAVLDGYDQLRKDPSVLASAEPGTAEHDRIEAALEDAQIKVAKDTLRAATTGDDWLEGAGTNEEQVFQAISTLRAVYAARQARLEKALSKTGDPARRKELEAQRATAKKEWEDERKALDTHGELSGAEQERATLLKGGELSEADEIYLAGRDDDEKVVTAVTAAWGAKKIDTVLEECRTPKLGVAGAAERPAYMPNLLTRIGTDDWYRVNALVKESVSDAERGAARLAFEINQGDSDSDLRKAHDVLATAEKDLALATVEQYAKTIPAGSEKPIQRFLDHMGTRYSNSKTVWDLRDMLDPGKTAAEHLARAKGRLEAADTGLADELLAGLHRDYDELSGEQTKATTQESLERLEFLVKANAEQRATFAKQLGKPVEQVSAHEYSDFKQRLAEGEAVEAAMVQAIATTLELVVSAAITAATGGAAAGLLLASLSSAVAGILVREIALGDDYDTLSKENAKKLASAIGGAALGAVGGELMAGATALDDLGKLGTFVGEATQEAFSQVGSGVVEAAFDNKAPTVESIAAKAVSMVVSMGASGASGVIKFDLKDAAPLADQVRLRFGAAVASSTINALGGKAAELTASGGLGDMTGAELLGQVAKDCVQAVQAGLINGAGDLGAELVRERRAAIAAAKVEAASPPADAPAHDGAGNGGGFGAGGGGDDGSGGGDPAGRAEIAAHVEHVRSEFVVDFEHNRPQTAELNRQLDKIAKDAAHDPAAAAELLKTLEAALRDLRVARQMREPEPGEEPSDMREAASPHERSRVQGRDGAAEELARDMEAKGMGAPAPSRNLNPDRSRGQAEATHHMAAFNDRRAELLRRIVGEEGLHRNSGELGVHMPGANPDEARQGWQKHANAHTDDMYIEMTLRSIEAMNRGVYQQMLERTRGDFLEMTEPLAKTPKQERKFLTWVVENRDLIEETKLMSEEDVDAWIDELW